MKGGKESMETSALQFIIANFFPQERLEERFPGPNPVENAVEAILNEESEGDELIQELDDASARQREKVRSMAPRELRNSLSVEFLEPGRRLALIVWALLRDDRLSARSHASRIVEAFQETYTSPSPSTDSFESEFTTETFDDIETEEPLDVEPVQDTKSPSIEVGEEDLDVDDLLADIQSDDIEDVNIPDEQDIQAQKIRSTEEDLEMDDVTDEVDSFLASLSEEEEPEEEELDLGGLESVLGAEDEKPAEEEEIDLGELENVLGAEEEDEHIHAPLSDDQIDQMLSGTIDVAEAPNPEEEPHLSTYSEDELNQELAGLDEELEEMEETGVSPDEDDIDSMIEEDAQAKFPADIPDETEMVSLGGVDISLASLKRACERVFQEPIELVVDQNLTESDRIVVVGKKCGVRVLHGPRYEIYSEADVEPIPQSPVDVSPTSLQAALSRVYDESVELVPDPRLLGSGIVIFAGKENGLSVVQNKSINVPTPNWVEGELKQVLRQETETEDTTKAELAELRERMDALESALASQPAPAPPAPAEPEPEPEPEEEAVE
ncbi:hypothetical protein GF373_16770, partial [bacterium]|nr:hypothetical protein [bacterium]